MVLDSFAKAQWIPASTGMTSVGAVAPYSWDGQLERLGFGIRKCDGTGHEGDATGITASCITIDA
jgi:hypothetical protein